MKRGIVSVLLLCASLTLGACPGSTPVPVPDRGVVQDISFTDSETVDSKDGAADSGDATVDLGDAKVGLWNQMYWNQGVWGP